MSANNKKNMVTQALLEMDEITAAIKEESVKALNTLLVESVKDAIRMSCDESQDDEYEVEDGEDKNATDTEEMSQDSIDSTDDINTDVDVDNDSEDIDQEVDAEAQEGSEVVDTEDDSDKEWSEFSKYQVGDDTYDLTGENDYENVVKVYKLLKDDDQIVVRKHDDMITLKDDSVGTEYVIDLSGENEATEVNGSEENFDSVNEGILGPDDPDFWPTAIPRNNQASDIAGFESKVEDGENFEEPISAEHEPNNREISRASRNFEYNPGDLDINNLLDDEDDYFGDSSIYESKINNKNKKTRKPMKESKEVLFEVDLGYTDNYQDKDPIAGLSNNEPSKSGKSWHKGVPTNTTKPWAGETKSKGEPFEKTISEEEIPEVGVDEMVDEATNVGGAVQQRTSSKSHIPANRKEYGPMNKRHVSAGGEYEEMVAENKKLKAENKELKEAIISFRKHLNEAFVTNANLGKITKLFLENTTSQAEKVDIVNRFSNEAKTIEQSKALYESIKRELNKNVATQMPLSESMTTPNGTEVINEQKVYKSNDLLKTIEFMNRMNQY